MFRRKVTLIGNQSSLLLDAAAEAAETQKMDRPLAVPGLRIGTSAFTAAGWESTFYPAGMQSRDCLSYYATQFNSVEVDSTFYRIPPASTFNRWYEATPPDFKFALKIPQVITHEKLLLDCEKEFDLFIERADLLDDKLGPLLFQFGYFNKESLSRIEFLKRLRFFLQRTKGMTCRFAVEIRNKNWLDAEFAGMLRDYKVALALQDQSWMSLPWQHKFDPITTSFTYVRWLGDRKGIEKITKVWDRVVVDRTAQLKTWVDYMRPILHRGVTIYAYANNHYAGFGPATIAEFLKLWNE